MKYFLKKNAASFLNKCVTLFKMNPLCVKNEVPKILWLFWDGIIWTEIPKNPKKCCRDEAEIFNKKVPNKFALQFLNKFAKRKESILELWRNKWWKNSAENLEKSLISTNFCWQNWANATHKQLFVVCHKVTLKYRLQKFNSAKIGLWIQMSGCWKVKCGLKRAKMGQNGPKWSKMVQKGP